VRLVQTSQGARHGVYFPFARETIAVHTERNPDDPRITHELVLDVDDFGNVTRKAAIAYARATASAVEDEQKQAWATLNEAAFINNVTGTFYRLGLPYEEKSFELVDVPGLLPGGQALVDREALRTAILGIPAARDFPYDATPTGTGLKRRMLAHSQHLYYDNDATGTLPTVAAARAQAGSLALPFESYTLALTAGLVQEIVDESAGLAGVPLNPSLLTATDGGAYARRPGDDGYWIPTGRAVFDPAQFYLPRRRSTRSIATPLSSTTTFHCWRKPRRTRWATSHAW